MRTKALKPRTADRETWVQTPEAPPKQGNPTHKSLHPRTQNHHTAGMIDQSGSLNLAFKAGSSVEGGTGRYDGSPKESPHQSRSGRGRGFLGCPPWEVEAGPVQDHTRDQRQLKIKARHETGLFLECLARAFFEVIHKRNTPRGNAQPNVQPREHIFRPVKHERCSSINSKDRSSGAAPVSNAIRTWSFGAAIRSCPVTALNA